jgi:LAO/AO transport system kinase
MVDFFLALMLPGAGDELQGLKKGVVELADMIAVNKADGDNVARAAAAAAEYRAALHILTPRSPIWTPPVVTYSALTGVGIASLWEKVLEHREKLTGSGEIAARRREQQIKWMWTMFDDTLRTRLRSDSVLKDRLPQIEADVADGRLSPTLAIEEITRTLGLSS